MILNHSKPFSILSAERDTTYITSYRIYEIHNYEETKQCKSLRTCQTYRTCTICLTCTVRNDLKLVTNLVVWVHQKGQDINLDKSIKRFLLFFSCNNFLANDMNILSLQTSKTYREGAITL